MVRKIIYVLLFIFMYLFSGIYEDDSLMKDIFSLRKALLINGIFIRIEMLVI